MRLKKIYALVFGFALLICLVLTCTFGIREIGRDVFKLYKSERENISLSSIDKLFSTVDKTLSDNFFFHEECIDLYGLILRVEGKNKVLDADETKTVLKGTDDKLYFSSPVLSESDSSQTYEQRISENVNSLAGLKRICDKNNVSFLYVNAPAKCNPDDKDTMSSYNYFELSHLAENLMQKDGIVNINYMEELKKNVSQYSNGFFITDHHWNTLTAFSAFERICETLNSTFDSNIESEYYDINNFSVETYRNAFLGSMGTRTGKYFAGKDDIDVIYPKFETTFKVSYETKTLNESIVKEGSFEEVIHEHKPGYHYITSDNSIVECDNLLIEDGHKVLLIKDSFGVPVSGWISCWADKLILMDLRYEQEKSVIDVIEENDIDTVIIIYNAEMLVNTSLFNFETPSMGY